MDSKYYCDVCKILCGDATGILLHMISVEHNQAYQSYLKQRQRKENPTSVRRCGNNRGANHLIESNPGSENHKETASEMAQKSLDQMSSSLQRIFSGIRNDGTSINNKNEDKKRKKRSPAAPKKGDIILQIIVTGFSCSLETVRKSFSEFGRILTFQVIGGIVCITYLYMSSVDKFLCEAESNKIIIDKIEFEIIMQSLKSVKGHNVSKVPDSLDNMFSSGIKFESKMKELMFETELDWSERERQNQACLSIVQCLHDKFDPVAHPFGSRIAGLGTKTSDLDVYLEITKPPKLVDQIKTKSNLKIKSIVYSIGDCLQADGNFSKIVRIPKASTAIVKCIHKPTGISCDISFQAPYGVIKTSVKFFYLSLDYRVKPLLVFIRFWAKVHGFSGINKFHSHTLSMMVIFYLQQISILPTVATLINNAQECDRNLVGFWECGFSDDISLLPKTENTSSFFEVLKGFFQFYSKFDFRKYVISPYLGVAIEKSLFVQGLESVYPTQFSSYLSNCKDNGEKPLDVTREICVQDIFVHNFNVAISLQRYEILHNFISFCNLYAEVCSSETFKLSLNCDKMLQERFKKQ